MLDTLLGPLEVAVSWIMMAFHRAFSPLFGEGSGVTWTLSIVGLVVVIRILLIPLFVKQIRSQRGLQLIQPEVAAIQKKYKGKTDPENRQKMSQELMALYKKHGTNPFSSCLPILAQAPVFFALFRVLNGISTNDVRGVLTEDLVESARRADFFGAPIPLTFTHAADALATGHSPLTVRIVTLTLIVAMSASTFITQRQLMRKNMPAAALEGSFAQQQKILLYVFPIIFAVSGVNFPIGVLLYWLTTNVWTMGQQFYVIRRMPAPGSQAELDLQARRAAHPGRGKGGLLRRKRPEPALPSEPEPAPEPTKPVVRQRQQPRRQPRGKRQQPTTRRPSETGAPGAPPGADSRPEAS